MLFFFQAEDGIRALYVTGVQTCALPISTAAGRPAWRARARSDQGRCGGGRRRRPGRSEERRVGKEYSAGGARDHWSRKNGNRTSNLPSMNAQMGMVMRHTLGVSLYVRHD